MTRPNPVCPGCGSEVAEISFSKTFIFVDGVRHSAGWAWSLSCCDATFLDDEMEWYTDDCGTIGPLVQSALMDKQGNVVMEWLDLVPEPEET